MPDDEKNKDEKNRDENGDAGSGEESGQPGESDKERVDRELIELLNELRVVLPGVQVLFAFLLTVPFTVGFPKMTGLQRDFFVGSFLCAAFATILLIAPSTYHRIQFRQKDKERMLHTSNRLAIAGTVFLALAMSAAVFVITDILFEGVWATMITAIAALLFTGFWYVLPLYRRTQTKNM